MGLCTSKDKEFDKYDKDQDGKMDKDELKKYVVEYNNGQLWQTVQLNLGLTEYEAQDCATLVAWQLSGGFNIATGQDNGGISMGAFTKFKTEYVEDPAGNQKFMLHTVFSSQDKDGNGYIDAEELDGLATKFFDGSWLKEGDPRMKNFKDKEHFKRLIHENCDEDKDGKFSFEEMVGVISGRANLVNDSAKNENTKDEFVDKVVDRAQPAQAQPEPTPGLDEWEQSLLNKHNELRALHGAPPLVWDANLKAHAQAQADWCQENNTLGHGNQGEDNVEGQNCFMSSPPAKGPRVVEDWYSEIVDFNWDEPSCTQGKTGQPVGHFTQVVWKSSTHVGAARSADGMWVAANYLPGGNMMGEEPENVLPSETVYVPDERMRESDAAPDASMRQTEEGRHVVGSSMESATDSEGVTTTTTTTQFSDGTTETTTTTE